MEKSFLMFRGGVRSITKTIGGKERTLHYHARTPDEIAQYLGAERRIEDTPEGDLQRQKLRAEFIAKSLCNEDGTPLLTAEEARSIPGSLKPEICGFIVTGSSETGDLGND